jgi:uncharacterized protein (TIGR00369 family)
MMPTPSEEPPSPGQRLSHRYCLMCGRDNPLSFGLRFTPAGDGSVATLFQSDESLQGYSGIMHGGVLSALLDTAMAHCLLHQEIEAVTGELNVRFFQPVACHSTLAIRAWIDQSLPPLYHLRAEIRVAGKRVCRAKGRFMARGEHAS